MNSPLTRTVSLLATALLLTLAGMAMAADQPGVRAVLEPAAERKVAPEFALKDRSGKTIRLSDYRGKVVVLDFWATWCTGCKKEIPWFAKFQKTYGGRRLAVIGISLDDGGWKVVRPFLKGTKVPYRILVGDDATARQYEITNMPDTFLIDQLGRVAAVYRAGLVDRDNLDANIKALIAQE